MLNIIIGHRGTGKSSWLKALKIFYKTHQIPARFFDLDKQIERVSGKSIFELFEKGESFFRNWEKKVFHNLVQSISKNEICFLAVGAGFVFKKQASWNVIHLCRYTDSMGRIFLNRPPLTPFQNPFKEYKYFYKKRNSYYLKQADEVLFRREHFKKLEQSDLLFLGLKKLSKPEFSLRLNPEEVPKKKEQLKSFLEKRLQWGLRFFELHDQTADKAFIDKVKTLVIEDKLLFSSQFSKKFCSIKKKRHWSWDLSLGPPPKGVCILSLHKRGKKSLKEILTDFSSYKKYHLKLAIEIFNFKELKRAYDWYCEDTKNRSFLPRSKLGSWLWFRQAFGSKMFLHFIKERPSSLKKGEVLDQPFLSEAVPFIKKSKALAGILADPVHFSATPSEQNTFFYKQNSIPVLPIPLKEADLTKQNLKIFSELGFVFFAVSSPLKKRAFLVSDSKDQRVQELKTANTLIFHNKMWKAFNTDWNGLQKLRKYSLESTFVWGGGGLRPVLKKLLPLASFYSARNSKPLKKKFSKEEFYPKTLIWAVGRKRMEQGCLMPPKNWKPSLVIDINYTEDSPGLEYALQVSAQYINGMGFFKKQARKQREIFKSLYLCEK